MMAGKRDREAGKGNKQANKRTKSGQDFGIPYEGYEEGGVTSEHGTWGDGPWENSNQQGGGPEVLWEEKGQKTSGQRGQGREDRRRKEEGTSGMERSMPHMMKRVDAATQQYFAEIASLIGPDGSITDPEERSILCGNALEEAQGKEVQLACDPASSRVLEGLLRAAEPAQVVTFLAGCGEDFFSIATNPNGSHVLESALRSTAGHLASAEGSSEGGGTWTKALKKALSAICQSAIASAYDLIWNRFASHVLRSLLALLSGDELTAPQPSPSLGTDPSTGPNAEPLFEPGQRPGPRANGGLAAKMSAVGAEQKTKREQRYPELVRKLAEGIFGATEGLLAELRVDTAAGTVLQALLKALEGDDAALSQTVATLLGCKADQKRRNGFVLEDLDVDDALALMEERAGSHLVEAMLRSSPGVLFTELQERLFHGNLQRLAFHPVANFVVQALIAAIQDKAQVKVILEELQDSFADLLQQRRAGVVAALLAACGRLATCQKEMCKGLARAVTSMAEGTQKQKLILTLLYLHQYPGGRMSVIGCAILQTILRFPKECCLQFLESFLAMEADEILAAAMDSGGSRVVEAYVEGGAPPKHKLRLISKLKGHFAELAMRGTSSHTLEKCFLVADVSTKEAMVAEVADAETGVSRTRHGAFLLRKLGVSQYRRHPEQWRKRLSTKDSTMRAFADIFASAAGPSGGAKGAPVRGGGSQGKGKEGEDWEAVSEMLSIGVYDKKGGVAEEQEKEAEEEEGQEGEVDMREDGKEEKGVESVGEEAQEKDVEEGGEVGYGTAGKDHEDVIEDGKKVRGKKRKTKGVEEVEGGASDDGIKGGEDEGGWDGDKVKKAKRKGKGGARERGGEGGKRKKRKLTTGDEVTKVRGMMDRKSEEVLEENPVKTKRKGERTGEVMALEETEDEKVSGNHLDKEVAKAKKKVKKAKEGDGEKGGHEEQKEAASGKPAEKTISEKEEIGAQGLAKSEKGGMTIPARINDQKVNEIMAQLGFRRYKALVSTGNEKGREGKSEDREAMDLKVEKSVNGKEVNQGGRMGKSVGKGKKKGGKKKRG